MLPITAMTLRIRADERWRRRLQERVENGVEYFLYITEPSQSDEDDVDLLKVDHAEQERLREGFIEMVAFIHRIERVAIGTIMRRVSSAA